MHDAMIEGQRLFSKRRTFNSTTEMYKAAYIRVINIIYTALNLIKGWPTFGERCQAESETPAA